MSENATPVTPVTFENLPKAVELLLQNVSHLESLMVTHMSEGRPAEVPEWMTLKELSSYHPEHPVDTTIYSWVRQNLIPYYKRGKRLTFKKSEIDKWLEESRQKTDAELQEEAVNHINQRRLAR